MIAAARSFVANAVRRVLAAVRARWMLAALALSYIGGWALLTWGAARLCALLGEFGPAGVPEVWIVSGGLFLLSLGGWGLLKDVAREGLYVLELLHRGR